MPDENGNAKIDPHKRDQIIAMLNGVAKSMKLESTARINDESGAIIFGDFEIWDKEGEPDAFLICVVVEQPGTRWEPPSADVVELAPTCRSVAEVVGNVFRIFFESEVSNAMQEHKLAEAHKNRQE